MEEKVEEKTIAMFAVATTQRDRTAPSVKLTGKKIERVTLVETRSDVKINVCRVASSPVTRKEP